MLPNVGVVCCPFSVEGVVLRAMPFNVSRVPCVAPSSEIPVKGGLGLLVDGPFIGAGHVGLALAGLEGRLEGALL